MDSAWSNEEGPPDMTSVRRKRLPSQQDEREQQNNQDSLFSSESSKDELELSQSTLDESTTAALSRDLPATRTTTKGTMLMTPDNTIKDDDASTNQLTTTTAGLTEISKEVEDQQDPESESGITVETPEALGGFVKKIKGSRFDQIRGCILKDYENHHKVIDGQYSEGVHYEKDSDKPIGKGGSGEVWKCIDKETKSVFCVKEILSREFDPKEVTLWLKVQNHDGFCKLHGAIERDKEGHQKVVILMEYGGETLRKILQKEDLGVIEGCLKTRFELRRALKYFQQLLSALHFMEQEGIVHHDIKSNNILILVDERTDILKVIDFGESSEGPEENYSDVECATWVFREMLTGHKIKDPTHTQSSGMGGDAPFFVPDSLCLTEDVKNLFTHGWQKDSEGKKFSAGDLLHKTEKIIKDLECAAQNNTIVSIEESQSDQLN
ncbi:probable myosin light chain kinase DDB_G0279831 [Lineus longissimus]|uniref:probable myosin light chain kinase DDB_G0279831 n=1 Tax=Lineus longissimus TaxID=88925 RepID=UPI002B4F01CF